VGPGAGLDVVENRKIPYCSRGSNPLLRHCRCNSLTRLELSVRELCAYLHLRAVWSSGSSGRQTDIICMLRVLYLKLSQYSRYMIFPRHRDLSPCGLQM
jgi:hypothetical protein